MLGYTLRVFKKVEDQWDLIIEVSYPHASGHSMMDTIYGVRKYGIAAYFNLSPEHQYDVDFV